MASSAGLRTTHPVIRFADEFGSLGSNPTPALMQQKVYRDLFECREENYALLNLATHDCPEFVRNCTSCDESGVTLSSIRNHYFAGFFAKVADSRYLAGVDQHALQVLAYYSPYYMDRFLAPDTQVRPVEAYDELLGQGNYEGVAIHAVRLAERVSIVAKAVHSDYYNTRSRCDCVSIYHAVLGRLQNDTKLVKSFSQGMLRVLAEGVMMQVSLAFKW